MKQSLCHSTTSSFVADTWHEKLSFDCPEQSAATRESIIHWLLGNDLKRFEMLNLMRVEIAQQEMEYRYRILRQRYLGIEPERAYRQLTNRLFSLVLLQNQIRNWIVLSRDRQWIVVDVLLEVLQELLSSDRYLQEQMVWIAQCSADVKLRNALLFASTEEYCLRPIRNQPLLLYWFVNYLQRNHQGGSIRVQSGDLIRLMSEELLTQDSENPLSLLNTKIVAQYQDTSAIEEQQAQRMAVKQKFEDYLAQKLDLVAVQWLQLYLQGWSQEAIASRLHLPITQIYRLRKKINHHAMHVFALKGEWH